MLTYLYYTDILNKNKYLGRGAVFISNIAEVSTMRQYERKYRRSVYSLLGGYMLGLHRIYAGLSQIIMKIICGGLSLRWKRSILKVYSWDSSWEFLFSPPVQFYLNIGNAAFATFPKLYLFFKEDWK